VLQKSLVGVIGSGLIGYDPFDRRTWSGSSYYTFSQLREQGALNRAFGVELPRGQKLWQMLRHLHPNRAIWRRHFYMSSAYREGLTDVVRSQLSPKDFDYDFFVLGAMFDVPGIVRGRSRCFSFHDGNLAQSLKAPHAPSGLSARRIDEGLAFERRVYHATDRIFSMSEYLRRSFIEDYGVPAERVSNVGAGINLDAVPEPFVGKQYDTQSILFIGVDFPRKGGQILLEAFRHVREVHPNATLHVVGPRELSLPGGLRSGVTHHGFLNKSNSVDLEILRGLFRKCSLFVLPSLYEPFGIAPLEAMVHEIPAVVSRGWALQEMVSPGVTGAHVEPGSVEDLANQLTSLLWDPQALQQMGVAARDVVLKRFTWPQVVGRMIAEIDSVQQGC
jgi:alpha-maltose-1-phosphate synthase